MLGNYKKTLGFGVNLLDYTA